MHFNEIFSPVVKYNSIGVLVAMVSMLDLELEQLDIKTSFVYGELEEQIYIKHQPEGFIILGKEDYAFLLKKSLHGFKQSLRQWYKWFNTFIVAHDIFRSQYNSCVYFRQLLDDSLVY